MTHLFTALQVVLGAVAVTNAQAQWTVTNLHPAGATESAANACSEGQKGGDVLYIARNRATLWDSADVLVDLSSADSLSYVRGMSGNQLVGYVRSGGAGAVQRASLWSGTAGSRVDLHPVGATESQALAVSGTCQAGFVTVNGFYRACLWNGTAASFVNFHPAIATDSVAFAASGAFQGGYVAINGVARACLWSGTASSMVDLSPSGSTNSSVLAMSDGLQAGYADLGGIRRASVWHGTASSWVDVHPAGATNSLLYGAGAGHQVGYAEVGGVNHAGMWSGTAGSWSDLHSVLPPGFARSYAKGVSSDGVNLYVVGFGVNAATGRNQALLWTHPLSCASDFNGDDVVDFFDYLDFVAAFADGSSSADFNSDSVVDFFDYLDFVQAFSAGC